MFADAAAHAGLWKQITPVVKQPEVIERMTPRSKSRKRSPLRQEGVKPCHETVTHFHNGSAQVLLGGFLDRLFEFLDSLVGFVQGPLPCNELLFQCLNPIFDAAFFAGVPGPHTA